MDHAPSPSPRLRLGVAVRRFHPYGGGEKFLGRLLDALPEARFELHLFTTGTPPPGRWIHHRVPSLAWLPWGRFWGFAWAAGRTAARAGVDLLYAHDAVLGPVDLFRAGGGCHPAYREAMEAADSPGRRLWEAIRPRHRLMTVVERRCFRTARQVVVNSERVKGEVIRHYGVASARVAVVYNGIDLDRFDPAGREAARAAVATRFPAVAGRVRLLYVGSGFRRKGVDTLLRGFARVAPAVRETFHLLVVGKEPRLARYRRLADQLAIGDRVTFTGPLGEVDELLLGCDGFCFPTRYEPFSNACLEALAAGLPVITTAANGVAERLADGGGAVVADAEDVDGFATAITQMADPAWREVHGARAREVAAGHTLAGYMTTWEALLEGLAEGRR